MTNPAPQRRSGVDISTSVIAEPYPRTQDRNANLSTASPVRLVTAPTRSGQVAVRDELQLAYEIFGDGPKIPIVLIMGLGSQMLLWHDRFCKQLSETGHPVIRFDNRDVGLSTRLEHLPTPSLRRLAAAGIAPGSVPFETAYALEDMADDAALFLDQLELPQAHIVGASMGGMIAQLMAIHHPQRVRTLTSIMSTPRPLLPSVRGFRALLRQPRDKSREAHIEHFVQVFQAIGGPHIPHELPRLREIAGRTFDRKPSGRGFLRHLGAILSSPDRTEALKSVQVPSLVIHGEVDPLVSLQGGAETAEAIPNARLATLPDMGHDLGLGLWPRLIHLILDHTSET